jgi:hypothetical protein
MNVRELMEELKKHDDNTPVKRVYGNMRIDGPLTGIQHRYLTHELIGIIKDKNRCLLLFEDL